MKYKILGLITARAGSKGITNKNKRNLAGKPLIVWTMEAAKESNAFSDIVLSTDDEDIVQIAKDNDVKVPFIRPKELAMDNSSHIDVIIHALNWLQKYDNFKPDIVVLLQPTSPLRNAYDIQESISIAVNKNADAVISLCECSAHPYLIKKISNQGKVESFYKTPNGYLPRQSFPLAYYINGAIFLAHTDILLEKKTWYTSKTYPYIMPEERSLDINTPRDLYLAELILKNQYKNGNNF